MNSAASGELPLAAWIKPGDTVVWGQAYAEPKVLTAALMRQRARIGRFRVFLGIASYPTCLPEHADHVEFVSYCASGFNARLVESGCLALLPLHYSLLGSALENGPLRADVVMLQVAPADKDGCYSLSLAHEYLLPALRTARVVMVEVNVQAPRLASPFRLHPERIDVTVHTDRPILEPGQAAGGEIERRIAQYIAERVPDGAVLQTGIGAIPDAALGALAHHRDLGVHSGSIGDGIVELIKCGAITNARKKNDVGVSVGGIFLGGGAARVYAHDNPLFSMRSSQYTHAADVLAGINRFVSINSAIEVDLTGQVNTETIGDRYVGAVGGALDFHRGAQRSKEGLPIIALPASSKGRSRIVSRLSGPATVARSDVGLVVTEHGMVDLRGLTLDQRRECMLSIAAPEHREHLLFESQRNGNTP